MDFIVFIVIALIALAIIDLMVGVANDAVNFLSSAIGSNAASRLTIMIIASFGVVAGVTLSSGLMEVARKGIFDPSFFTLSEIMVVFMAVMLTDVLLLDFFNTFGLPTSTTVSIVFELLGAALAVATIKTLSAGNELIEVATAINAPGVLKIVSGILLSIVAAFLLGSLTQYLTRLLFTFDYVSRIKRYGALWGALAITAISFFIILKGAKGASFITKDTSKWIIENTWYVAMISFVFWAIVLQILLSLFKVNIFKTIVLAGTFALAMAFAANDLVNFIGAPLAGINAYQLSLTSADPLNMNMGALAQKIQANTWYLLLAGAIMTLTLWINKKARTVTKTTVQLGRQDEGYERFQSIAPARGIVRAVIVVFNAIGAITPKTVKQSISQRFDSSKAIPTKNEEGVPASFDLVRASVNLMVAAILISIGTTLKLPLSTTYVTFAVAMATALPDRAWGRESAVYRVSGVMTVIGGWFFTAFLASTAAGIVATIVFYGEWVAIIVLLLFAGFLLYRSSAFHEKREKEVEEEEKAEISEILTTEDASSLLRSQISGFIDSASQAVLLNKKGLFDEDRGALKDAKRITKSMNKQAKTMTHSIIHTSRLTDEDTDQEQLFANAISALQRFSATVKNLTYQSFTHIDNNHNLFNETQVEELHELDQRLFSVLSTTNTMFAESKDLSLDTIHKQVSDLKETARKLDKNQLKRTKKEKYPSRTSLLFFEILSDTNALVDNLLILLHVSESLSVHNSKKETAKKTS